MSQRYGIIDIGSNSIRLVIYEKTEHGAHRVVDGSKRSARLSSYINEQGELSQEGIHVLIDTLKIFQLLAKQHQLEELVPIATAAIRNAANQADIVMQVEQETSLHIKILSGLEEAEYGFLGMINSISVQSGFLLDIGGGSSELTLFIDRKIIHSFSFPFGCVSLNKQFDSKQGLNDIELTQLYEEIERELAKHDWIAGYKHLPLVAVGGTARAVGKIHQASIDYPLAQTHNYPMSDADVMELFNQLRALPQDKRKKTNGLSKDRADVIIPGLAILTKIFQYTDAERYVICGAGLRDGVFHKLFFPEQPLHNNPLEYSIENLIALHTALPRAHTDHISALADQLLSILMKDDPSRQSYALYLNAAARLYRIGATIEYYQFAKHTFYLIVHSHLNGLSHKEILLVAAIASFRSKGKAKSELKGYSKLISQEDLDTISRLGYVLQLAAALDRSEAQSIQSMELSLDQDTMHITITEAQTDMELEAHNVEELASDFKKHWGVRPILSIELKQN
ncbi:Ppx/GppA phosphatase family protein [Paenibacillus camelliae]|uniref:Ppx/GppA phosphatase family protein n=1 Tax=Paenibacillus camelliae TaxID=512410 RepID=UPI0020418B1E|nr:Ppx/GppA phosphatase family protein [Paenibacillus camelliae]MCM3632512.1 Ppx/GppA family phosphatase [Paenibacillus camelliae]